MGSSRCELLQLQPMYWSWAVGHSMVARSSPPPQQPHSVPAGIPIDSRVAGPGMATQRCGSIPPNGWRSREMIRMARVSSSTFDRMLEYLGQFPFRGSYRREFALGSSMVRYPGDAGSSSSVWVPFPGRTIANLSTGWWKGRESRQRGPVLGATVGRPRRVCLGAALSVNRCEATRFPRPRERNRSKGLWIRSF